LPRYAFEQVKAETAAWETAEREGLDLVTLLPSHVVGPLLSTNSGVSGPSVSWMKVCSRVCNSKRSLMSYQHGFSWVWFEYDERRSLLLLRRSE